MKKMRPTIHVLLLCSFLLSACQNDTAQDDTAATETQAPTSPESTTPAADAPAPPPTSSAIPADVQELLLTDAEERAIEKLKLPANTTFIEDQQLVEKARENDRGYLVTLARTLPETGETKKVFVVYLYTGGDRLDINNYRNVNVFRE